MDSLMKDSYYCYLLKYNPKIYACEIVSCQEFDFLPDSSNVLFNGDVLAKRNGKYIILSVSQIILLLLHSLKKSLSLFRGFSLSECSSQNFCNFLIRHFFKSVHSPPKPFIESLLRLIQKLGKAKFSISEITLAVNVRLQVWNSHISSIPLRGNYKRESPTDDEYAYILAHVYLKKNIKNIYYNEIFPKYITSKNPFNYKSNLDRYLLISSSFIQCLYSNPIPTYFLLDKKTGVILLSKSMCQELLWLLPIPFKRYTEKVFKDFALFASYYFSKISEDDVNESFERLKAVKRWERRMQRSSIEDGLRAEIFLQFGQKMFKKMKKLEAMNDFIQSNGKVKADVLTRHFPRFQLNSGMKNLNLYTMTLRSAVLHRKWFIAARAVQGYQKTTSMPHKVQSQISSQSTWLIGLQLLSMQENCINFDRKITIFLEYMMKHDNFSKLEMQYDVYLWLLVKGYLKDACTLTVLSAKYLVVDKSDLIFRALMVCYENLQKYMETAFGVKEYQSRPAFGSSSTISICHSISADVHWDIMKVFKENIALLEGGSSFFVALFHLHVLLGQENELIELFRSWRHWSNFKLLINSTGINLLLSIDQRTPSILKRVREDKFLLNCY
ncbi:hypothetical protein T4B_7980 [Trichinella pseudospiralis]|uniref:Uncharacterized protein n=1 Tax=Trichinella pseudospiralis TaxID=6337 RepID=A0A0V1IFD4_TRIPS|nr:hypothetical protein T4B_7980 [Trichinella pseudospiralis]